VQAELDTPVSDILWLAGAKVAVAATLDGELWAFDRQARRCGALSSILVCRLPA